MFKTSWMDQLEFLKCRFVFPAFAIIFYYFSKSIISYFSEFYTFHVVKFININAPVLPTYCSACNIFELWGAIQMFFPHNYVPCLWMSLCSSVSTSNLYPSNPLCFELHDCIHFSLNSILAILVRIFRVSGYKLRYAAIKANCRSG
jgi:hypothetical protein